MRTKLYQALSSNSSEDAIESLLFFTWMYSTRLIDILMKFVEFGPLKIAGSTSVLNTLFSALSSSVHTVQQKKVEALKFWLTYNALIALANKISWM